MRMTVTLLAVAAAIAVPAAAHADTYNFTLEFDHDYFYGGTTVTETFSLPSMPTPSSYVTDEYFTLSDIPVVINGSSTTDTLTFLTTDCQNGGCADYGVSIYSDTLKGGYAYSASQSTDVPQQYFTGDVSDPTFVIGTYEISESGDDSPEDDVNLTITGPTVQGAATPEPTSLVLLGTGVLGLAGAARRRVLGA